MLKALNTLFKKIKKQAVNIITDMPFQQSEKQKKIRIKNSIEIESRIRLPCVGARHKYTMPSKLEKDVDSVNPIGLYRATFAAIGRCALLNCH